MVKTNLVMKGLRKNLIKEMTKDISNRSIDKKEDIKVPTKNP